MVKLIESLSAASPGRWSRSPSSAAPLSKRAAVLAYFDRPGASRRSNRSTWPLNGPLPLVFVMTRRSRVLPVPTCSRAVRDQRIATYRLVMSTVEG